MRLGTPGFSPHRLKAARQARGLTGAALAELVSISRSAISQYERGDKTPSPSVLCAISDKLNLRVNYFFKNQQESNTPVFYRSLTDATKSSRSRAQRRYEWLREVVIALSDYVEFPDFQLPDFLCDKPLELTAEDIERLAEQTRRFFGLGDGPISNVVWLLENSGVVVARHHLDSDKLDAFSNWPKSERAFVILGDDKMSAVRSRFDAAHELAHLVLHRKVTHEQLKTKEMFRLIEQQANRFAGAFLLPRSTFQIEATNLTLNGLLSLKKRWGASVALMIRRCADLEAVSPKSSKRLWINLGRRGWRKSEPFDDVIVIEQPRMISRSFALLRNCDSSAIIELQSRLPWTEEEIKELVGDRSMTFFHDEKEIVPPEPRVIRFPTGDQ